MVSYIIRRILTLIPMLFIMTFVIFLGLELMPGDAVSFLASPEAMANITQAQLDSLRDSLGLNDPFILRYLRWLLNICKGNFGYSITSGVPISEIIASRLPATIELSLAAIIISTFMGTLLGLLSAVKRDQPVDRILTVAGMLGVSIPEFFFGLVFLVIFAINLGLFPVGGRLRPDYVHYYDHIKNLVLPALVLGLSMTAGVMRYTRASMLDTINKDYIKTARSKGLPEWRINLFHGFRVALSPVVVLVGFRLPTLIGGSVVIEQIFQWPGIGNEFLQAVRGQNYPLVMSIALLSVFMVLLSSFIIDIITAMIDPRVQLD